MLGNFKTDWICINICIVRPKQALITKAASTAALQ